MKNGQLEKSNLSRQKVWYFCTLFHHTGTLTESVAKNNAVQMVKRANEPTIETCSLALDLTEKSWRQSPAWYKHKGGAKGPAGEQSDLSRPLPTAAARSKPWEYSRLRIRKKFMAYLRSCFLLDRMRTKQKRQLSPNCHYTKLSFFFEKQTRKTSRVPGQNAISRLYNMLERYHSCPQPSTCSKSDLVS